MNIVVSFRLKHYISLVQKRQWFGKIRLKWKIADFEFITHSARVSIHFSHIRKHKVTVYFTYQFLNENNHCLSSVYKYYLENQHYELSFQASYYNFQCSSFLPKIEIPYTKQR